VTLAPGTRLGPYDRRRYARWWMLPSRARFPPDQPGVRLLQGAFIAPGPDPSAYAYVKQEVQSNLFRIPIR